MRRLDPCQAHFPQNDTFILWLYQDLTYQMSTLALGIEEHILPPRAAVASE